MRYVALICARGGSKGLPGKNIKSLGGVPLIGRSIQIAKQVNRIDRVIVSTDSEIIANIAREYGAEVPFMRPTELAKDTSSEWPVWQHALGYLERSDPKRLDGIISLPTTAPLRDVLDVENCIDEYEKGNVDVVITVTEARRSPYFNMIIKDNKGYSSLVISNNKITRRQDTPIVYDMSTVAYVANAEYVKNSDGLFDGRVRSVEVPIERAIDIDTEFDFKIAECILQEKLI
ncbi:acylneuraminate cytidylyltransferase family protein [Candidatus Woesearchaeota archaeon]|jgi:CMP-N-acetylneuraminic acid synthetase|nr:acylneuraminate cytidylyltransferase family protein [Candidatus Woesearchaeota archaeon]